MIPISFAGQDEALGFFDDLAPVRPADMVGLWQGRGVTTGHPLDGVLENLGWFGKRFHPDLRADALLFQAGSKRLVPVDPAAIPVRLAIRFGAFGRTRIARNWFSYIQKAIRANGPVAALRSISFREKSSAALVYDRQPITDHFRWADDRTLLGAMAMEGETRHYFFTLSRITEQAA